MSAGVSRITLPRIRSIEEPKKEVKLCGGDLYRARAPAPPSAPMTSEARGYERKAEKKKPVRDPRKTVNWTDETVETMERLLASGLSRGQTADELNKLFPQPNGIPFTRNSIAGKINNLKLARERNQ